MSDRPLLEMRGISKAFPGVIALCGVDFDLHAGEVNTPDQGLKLMEDFMQTFPQIDGVMCAADFLAIGAAQAIRAAGKSGKIKVVTVDLQPDAEKLLRGDLLTGAIVQTAQIMGRWGVRAAINRLGGRTVPPQLFTPIFVVTKDNADQVDFTLERGPVGWRP